MTLPERLIAGEIALADYPIALRLLRKYAEAHEGFFGSENFLLVVPKTINHVREREGDEAAEILASVLLGEGDGPG